MKRHSPEPNALGSGLFFVLKLLILKGFVLALLILVPSTVPSRFYLGLICR